MDLRSFTLRDWIVPPVVVPMLIVLAVLIAALAS